MTQYIGYDLGDGDTLVSYRRNAGEGIKDALMPGYNSDKQGIPIPTVLSVDNDGKTLIGLKAMSRQQTRMLDELAVNFKRRPSMLRKEEYNVFKDRVVRFTDALFLDEVFFKNTIDADDSELLLYIGHPTLWNEQDVKEYQKILKSCGFIEEYRKKGINVTVGLAKESQAAMLNIKNRKEDGTASKENVGIKNGSYIVLFDFGSSTTDVTVIHRDGDYKPVDTDYGDCNLGARLIDRGIYRLVFNKLDEKKQEKLCKSAILESHAVYCCRVAKETYFGYSVDERVNTDWSAALVGRKFFPLPYEFESAMVHEAASLKWPELKVEGKDEELSYAEAVRELFTKVAKSMEEQGMQPSLVILTGGASRMEFIQTLCRQTFAKTKIYLDDAPSSCISRGLVYTATRAEEVEKFEKEVKKFCQSGTIASIIEQETSALANEIAQYVGGKALGIIQRKLFSWRDSRIATLSDMEWHIEKEVEHFLNSSECKQEVKRITENWYSERVIRTINRRIEGICSNFDIVYKNQLASYVKGVQCGWNNITISGTTVEMEPAVVSAIQELFWTVIPIVLVVLMPIIVPLVVSVVVTIVASITTFIAGVIFMLLGTVVPGGWGVIAGIVGISLAALVVIGWEGVKDKFMKGVKTADLWPIVRNRVSDSQIHTELAAQRSKIYDEISYKIRNDSRFRSELKDKISSASSKIVEATAKQITFDLSR